MPTSSDAADIKYYSTATQLNGGGWGRGKVSLGPTLSPILPLAYRSPPLSLSFSLQSSTA